MTPIKLATVEGSIELERDIYRECVDLVKATRPVRVVSFVEEGSPQAFMHYIENSEKPFAVAIYANGFGNTRYFLLMKKIPLTLRAKIQKLEKFHAKQDKPASNFLPTGRSFTFKRKGIRPGSSSKLDTPKTIQSEKKL